MMTVALRRSAAVALLVGGVGGLCLAVAAPLLSATASYDAAIEELSHRLGKYEQVAALREPLQDELAFWQQTRPTADALLGGDSEALAGAELQELIKQIVLASGGRPESSEVLSVSTTDPLERITVRVRFAASVPALQRVVHRIESGRPLLFVDSLDVRAKQVRRNKRQIDPSQPVLLKVSLDLYGYRRGEGQ